MRYFLFALGFAALLLPACGKYLDKFGRLDPGYTRVHFDGERSLLESMSGGLMIYFVDANNGDAGKGFGFTSAEAAMQGSIVVPNGAYKVIAFGTDTGNIMQGQAKCGLGNGGVPVTLSGGASTINLLINADVCAFGTDSPFSTINGAATGNTNYDTITFNFCQGSAYPACTAVSSSYRVRYRWAGGEKFLGGAFVQNEALSLTSDCSSAMTGGIISTSFISFLGSSNFSPPMEVLVYSDSTCQAGAMVGRVPLTNLYQSTFAASGSSVYVSTPGSNGTTTIKLKFP